MPPCIYGSVRLWDVRTDQTIATLKGDEHWVKSVAFSPDGHELAAGYAGGKIRLWNAQTSQAIATLLGQTSDVQSVAFSPDGTCLASGSQDGPLCLAFAVGADGHAPVPGEC